MTQVELIKEAERLRLTRPELVAPGDEKTPYDIALIGEQDVDWDLQVIQQLVGRLGVRVTGVVTGDARPEALVPVFDAGLSVVSRRRSATRVAEMIWDDYLIPYVWASFFGRGRTSETLRGIGRHFGLLDEAEAVISAETAHVEPLLAGCRTRLEGKTAAVCADEGGLWLWIEVLEELGLQVVAGMCLHPPAAGCAPIDGRAPAGVTVADNPGAPEIEALLAAFKPDLFLYCGPGEMAPGHRTGVPTLRVQPGPGSYGGYAGLVHLARDLCRTLGCPVGS